MQSGGCVSGGISPIGSGGGMAVQDVAGGIKTHLKVRGRWRYPYRTIDRDGDLVDTMPNERRDVKAARSFLRSARAVTGVTPDRVTSFVSAEHFRRGHDELRDFLRPSTRHDQPVAADRRRLAHVRRAAAALANVEAAEAGVAVRLGPSGLARALTDPIPRRAVTARTARRPCGVPGSPAQEGVRHA